MKNTRKLATRDSIANNYVSVPRYFLERGRHLTANAKWVWVVLRSFENRNNKLIYPSFATIEALSGLSKTAVANALAELENFHWIIRTPRKKQSTLYRLNFEAEYNNNPAWVAEIHPLPDREVAAQYKANKRAKRKTEDQKRFSAFIADCLMDMAKASKLCAD